MGVWGLRGRVLAGGHGPGGAADEHALDLVRRTIGTRVQPRGPADLLALPDLDHLAETGPSVPGQVHRERACRRARRRVFWHPEIRREHTRLPGRATSGER